MNNGEREEEEEKEEENSPLLSSPFFIEIKTLQFIHIIAVNHEKGERKRVSHGSWRESVFLSFCRGEGGSGRRGRGKKKKKKEALRERKSKLFTSS